MGEALGHLGGPQGQHPSSESGSATIQLDESALLAQLVELLARRHKHCLLLSDLGALLPSPLRRGVRETGGLRCWLQKFPNLFLVTGQPGKESVSLLLGSIQSGEEPAGT